MNKIRTAMTAAFTVSFSLAVYGILRGHSYIAEVSWIIFIGMIATGVIIFSSKNEHTKEVSV